MRKPLAWAFLAALFLASLPAAMAEETNEWIVLGRQHVRDGAEKDLAVLKRVRGLHEVRICVERNAVRIRNAIAWLPRGQRQRLWLPLVMDSGDCSEPIRLENAPGRITHVALEYEALTLGAEGAHLVIEGRRLVASPL